MSESQSGLSLTFFLYRLAGAVLPAIPTVLGYRLAEIGGALIFALSPDVRRRVCANLSHVLAQEPDHPLVRVTARRMLGNLVKNYFDLFRLPRLTPAQSAQFVEVQGWQHIETSLSRGKGLIVVSAHLGNIEIVVQIFARHGVAVTIPVERLQPPRLFDYICRLRSSHGLRLVPIDGPLLMLYRALRRGEVVGLAADRDITASGQVAHFFGAPAQLPDGHVRLALRTGAPLLCAFSQRLAHNRFLAHILPPLELAQSGNPEADVAAGVRQVLATVEQAIAQHPDQWYVSHAVWPLNHQSRRRSEYV